MIQLNLLPEVKKEFLKAQRLKRNIISASLLAMIIAVGLVVLLAIYVHGIQPFARTQLQQDIDQYSQQLEETPDINRLLTVQNALVSLPELHNDKYANSRLFNYLTAVVPSGIGLSRANVEHSLSTITFNGVASDYRTLNVFVDTLKNAQFSYTSQQGENRNIQPFTRVTITNASTSTTNDEVGVAFTVTAEFDDAIFDRRNTQPSMTVPNITVGQGVVEPSELFRGTDEDEVIPQDEEQQ